MNIFNFISYVLCVIVCVDLDLVGAQLGYIRSGYGRRGYLGPRRRLYPTGLMRPPLLHRPIGGVVPAVLPIGHRRGPDVVSDTSERTNMNLNIQNNNVNEHHASGSGNSRVSTRDRRTCSNACPGGTCPYPSQCIFTGDTECPTRCQSVGIGMGMGMDMGMGMPMDMGMGMDMGHGHGH